VRFLQAISRQVGKVKPPADPPHGCSSEPDVEIVASFRVEDKVLRPWQEAMARDVAIPLKNISELLNASVRHPFVFEAAREFEAVPGADGQTAAYFIRTRQALHGCIELDAKSCGDGVFRLTVTLSNSTPLDNLHLPREEVLLNSFLSAHTLLYVSEGEFVSLTDPLPGFQEIVAGCRNIGTWPVMIGDDRARNEMLSSPIILYDYPQVAPESPGDLFDGTEIDEILALRILTLSDDEKREISESDSRTREVLQRTEDMPMEHFMKLHGVLREMKPGVSPSEDSQSEGAK
jgi:hydrogenase maturation protease